jgi:thiol:disulfide interchange protein DsbD
MAVYFLKPVLREPGSTIALAAVSLAAGTHLGWFGRGQAGSRGFAWLKAGAGAAGLALATFLVAGLLLRGPGVAWTPYSEEALAEARRLGRPVVVDFYAAWCAPCRELDEVTFHDAAVVRAARERFVMIKVDVTRAGDPGHDRLLREFAVKGVPTVVFLDAGGRERADLRLVVFLGPEQFLDRMNRLARSGG